MRRNNALHPSGNPQITSAATQPPFSFYRSSILRRERLHLFVTVNKRLKVFLKVYITSKRRTSLLTSAKMDFTSFFATEMNNSVFLVMAQQPQTTELTQSFEESLLTDDFVVNMVDKMEENALSTIDYDTLKFAPTDNFSDLLTLETQYQDINTSIPVMGSPDYSSSMTASPGTSSQSSSPAPSLSYFESSLYSPLPSPATSIISHMSGEESLASMVSPSEVLDDKKKAPGKKRGRKPKSESGLHQIMKKQKKPKVYELDQPLPDKTLERKRLNAVNAKRHRDMQKAAREELERQLSSVVTERDLLKQEVENLKAKEEEIAKQLEIFKNHIKSQQLSALTLLQSTSTF